MKLRDILVFAAGAEFFHTITHIMIVYAIPLPLDLKFFQLTSNLNCWAIGVNAVIMVFLLLWAKRLK